MDALFLKNAPPFDPAWLEYEGSANLLTHSAALSPLKRQGRYASECRLLTAKMTAPGTRDHHLRQITKTHLTMPSTSYGFPIPMIKYGTPITTNTTTSPLSTTTILYIHGGGLLIGEADSEELSCLRISDFLSSLGPSAVYSVGYRLMPTHAAQTCPADCLSVFSFLKQRVPKPNKLILVGSSSGG